MGRHVPGCTWPTHRIDDPRGTVYVDTNDPDNLRITVVPPVGCGVQFTIERRHARLLAKRINQCLEETRSKTHPGIG